MNPESVVKKQMKSFNIVFVVCFTCKVAKTKLVKQCIVWIKLLLILIIGFDNILGTTAITNTKKCPYIELKPQFNGTVVCH
jgi:hypothetical protein